MRGKKVYIFVFQDGFYHESPTKTVDKYTMALLRLNHGYVITSYEIKL